MHPSVIFIFSVNYSQVRFHFDLSLLKDVIDNSSSSFNQVLQFTNSSSTHHSAAARIHQGLGKASAALRDMMSNLGEGGNRDVNPSGGTVDLTMVEDIVREEVLILVSSNGRISDWEKKNRSDHGALAKAMAGVHDAVSSIAAHLENFLPGRLSVNFPNSSLEQARAKAQDLALRTYGGGASVAFQSPDIRDISFTVSMAKATASFIVPIANKDYLFSIHKFVSTPAHVAGIGYVGLTRDSGFFATYESLAFVMTAEQFSECYHVQGKSICRFRGLYSRQGKVMDSTGDSKCIRAIFEEKEETANRACVYGIKSEASLTSMVAPNIFAVPHSDSPSQETMFCGNALLRSSEIKKTRGESADLFVIPRRCRLHHKYGIVVNAARRVYQEGGKVLFRPFPSHLLSSLQHSSTARRRFLYTNPTHPSLVTNPDDDEIDRILQTMRFQQYGLIAISALLALHIIFVALSSHYNSNRTGVRPANANPRRTEPRPSSYQMTIPGENPEFSNRV